MKQKLKEIISNIGPVSIHGSLHVPVDGLSYDAFTVRPGELFLATEGVNVDRHRYIDMVIQRGITAVLHSKPLASYAEGVTYVQVKNVQRAMSPVSADFYSRPSNKLYVIGVTGTNGKSTTCSIIYQLLQACSRKAGIISSVSLDIGKGISDNAKHQSTPEAPLVQKALYDAVSNGIEYMVLETTSHSLSERTNRVGDVEYDAAVLTNITHEHLDFHGTMERYIDDKANLFRLMSRYGGRNAFGVVNSDDDAANVFTGASSKPVYTYGIERSADLNATEIRSSGSSTAFTVNYAGAGFPAVLSLPGRFNVANALAASLTVIKATDTPVGELLSKLRSIEGIRGRMQPVNCGQPFRVIVDFAHTPDSFARLLPEARALTVGKLIVVFGSAGERDTTKREKQGEIASTYADIVILADEDPRGEDPMEILEQIAAGCPHPARGSNLLLIPDRKEAILKAVRSAGKDDTVLLLGKGHETTISYSKGDIPWDEVKIACECLAAVGYG